jgi:hypothetical protein
MNVYKLLLAIPAMGVMFALALLLYGRFSTRNVADREQLTTDPLHQKLHLLNPQLRIVDALPRVPVYWIKLPGTKDGILFPKAEAEGARIHLQECDLSAIPRQVLYPNRSEMACLEIDNDAHKLSAYFFRTRDSLKTVVTFFEARIDPGQRLHSSGPGYKERREVLSHEDGSREFLFSYFLWENYDLVGFVGYREELKPGGGDGMLGE